MASWLAPHLTRLLTSNLLRLGWQGWATLRRRLGGHRPTLRAFLRADDPYSVLLALALAELRQRAHATLCFETRLIGGDDPAMVADPERATPHARHDGNRLAALYGYDVRFHAQPTPGRLALAQALLVAVERRVDGLELSIEILKALWSGHDDALPAVGIDLPSAAVVSRHLSDNEALLAKQGHFQSAVVHFEGDWYWGLDRLMFLEQRLNAMALCRRIEVRYDRSYRNFCGRGAVRRSEPRPPLELFLSLRSPYSYVGFVKAQQFARHHDLTLVVRPVLPMVMRGLAVPRRKALHILFDACREARWWQVPFGTIADPLGAGVIRSYQVLEYAFSIGQEQALLSSLFKGIWAEGRRAETDRGLRFMVERAGLSWDVAVHWLGDTRWQKRVDQNQAALTKLAYWGVPVLKLGEVSAWGQDRFWVIESALANGAYFDK